jgi:hypothetical protein
MANTSRPNWDPVNDEPPTIHASIPVAATTVANGVKCGNVA